MVGKPKYVDVAAVDATPDAVTRVVEPPTRRCAVPTTGKPTFSQPFWKPTPEMSRFATLVEPSTFDLVAVFALKVSTFASQHSAAVCVGGGGEKFSGVDVVCSSRSKIASAMSSQEPLLPLKLRWNGGDAEPVPVFT